MRKLLTLPLFLSLPLAAGIAQAAPANQPKCTHNTIERVKDGTADVPRVENGNFVPAAVWENCFADEIFVLDGDVQVNTAGTPGDPLAVPPVAPVPGELINAVECKDAAAKDCSIGRVANQLNGGDYEAVALKALELIKGMTPTIEYDEVVLFSPDYAPGTGTAATSNGAVGPLFFRASNAQRQPINPVANIAPLGVLNKVDRDPSKPYVGVISAGSVKSFTATPWTGTYTVCGSAPRRAIDNPSPSEQQAAALCAPGLYTYFDALAQATANIYGPYLGVVPEEGKSFSTMPLIKGNLVEAGPMDTVQSKVAGGGPTTNVWNAFLNTQGSILGGNTWRDSGNGTFSVTRPPAYQGVSAPFEGGQVLRFTNMDLY